MNQARAIFLTFILIYWFPSRTLALSPFFVCVFSFLIFTVSAQILCRLVTKDTVDENVYEIAKRKLKLDAAVLESGVEVNDEGGMSEKTMGEILSALLLG